MSALTITASPAMARAGRLDAGQTLASGGILATADGAYQLVMQGDGNLVLYRMPGSIALWSSKTYGHAGSRAVMQSDGNFVVYQGGAAIWSSATYGHPGTFLKMQKSGNVVLFAPGRVQIWSTGTGGGYVIKDRDNIDEVKSVAHRMAVDRGWTAQSEWNCLDQLWDKESGWHWNADNPYSEAYGIPQANPGSKMSSAGADWHENPVTQIKWGFGYIAERYSTPCGAWSFWQSHGWYSPGQ